MSSDKETINSNDKESIDIETLSTILTDAELRPDEIKKIDENKANLQNWNKINQDINIKNIDDLINIIFKNSYDFFVIEPYEEYIKISFKKDSIIKETKYIKYPVYFDILLNAKKICKLNIDQTKEEQKWTWEYTFWDKNYTIISKTEPTNNWEKLYLKLQQNTNNKWTKTTTKKSKVSIWAAFSFLAVISFIILIIWWAFLTFVIFNAKTPEDVSFFVNLWINLNDINNFLSKITTIVFFIMIFIETIILIIFLFKALLTKKEFKRKKTVYTILSIFFLILTFSTWTLWATTHKVIKTLPEWWIEVLWDIKIIDNDKLFNWYSLQDSIISDTSNMIWPITIKYDLSRFVEKQTKQWYRISSYIWDFWDWKKEETLTPEIVHTFDKKWVYNISLVVWGNESWSARQKTIDIPKINIWYSVKMTEEKLSNWGKTIVFDASDLSKLWKIEWYLKEDLEKPAYVWELFQPSKVYFEEEFIWMKIQNKANKSSMMDKIFAVSWEKTEIKAEIKWVSSIYNDLKYDFFLENIQNQYWEWFIETFKWIINWNEILKKADKLNLEESSKIEYDFKDYWKHKIKVILTNSNQKSSEINFEINIPRKINIENQLRIYNIDDNLNEEEITDIKYIHTVWEYYLYDINIPGKLVFDTRSINASDKLYYLEEVNWDFDWDWNYEEKGKKLEKYFSNEWNFNIWVKYKFTHRKNKDEKVEVKEFIFLETIEKDAIIVLNMKAESEYAPTMVSFDASLSKAKNDNIVKFIYDYWDWTQIEERDAKNTWHKYLKQWNYKIKLTAVTAKWKEYTITKNLILKQNEERAKIFLSMKKAPINQYIDFFSSDSIWQIVWYHWDFWDWNISNDANPSHSYKTPWKYKVKLTLDFANNNVVSEETELEITD